VTVTGGSNRRVSLAALIAIKPGQHPRLICRVHKNRRRGKNQRKGFTETGYSQLLDAAGQQLSGPVVIVWDNLNTPRQRRDGRVGRRPRLADRLPAAPVRPRTEPGRAGVIACQALPGPTWPNATSPS
jgi:hypothetical protein